MLKLVPFNPAWINHDKIDIHAIYRRPRFVEDKFGEKVRELDAGGVGTWDLTGPLPIKQHVKWTTKGFEYVTLADRDSLVTAGRFGTIEGDWRQYDQHQTGGPWNYKKYFEGQQSTTTLEAQELREDVMRYGSEAVEYLRRKREPTFTLPADLKGIQPGGVQAKVEETPAPKAVGKKAEATA